MLSVILASVLKTQILQDKVGNMRAEQVCVRDNKVWWGWGLFKGAATTQLKLIDARKYTSLTLAQIPDFQEKLEM